VRPRAKKSRPADFDWRNPPWDELFQHETPFSHVEMVVATTNEVGIERALKKIAHMDESERRDLIAAHRQIVRLRIEGKYDKEVARLLNAWLMGPVDSRAESRLSASRMFRKYAAVWQIKDESERNRHLAAYDALFTLNPNAAQLYAIEELFEQPKISRSSGSCDPRVDCSLQLAEMTMDCEDGMSVAAAAMKAVGKHPRKGGTAKSQAKDLENKYWRRVRLGLAGGK